MTAIWMTLNFLLIVLAFYLILQLFQRVRLQQSEAKQETGELEKLFAAYLEDLQKENDRFIQALSEATGDKQVSRRRTAPRASRPVRSETAASAPSESGKAEKVPSFRQILKDETAQQDPVGKKTTRSQPADDHAADNWVPPVDEIQDQLEESLPLQALKLKKKGYTATQIAKELKTGKEEIELLLKFQGKKKL
ncbi:hypothetical protein [Sporolactobacillus vineae]|uniref:hypothetical protein n=1 Tax=Sporolactobacillus vineae TaxID=444463 RepID=UPI0002899064|nr:hypothetical protein [Sporolactobacillus vineae]